MSSTLPARINFVTLGVADVARATEFYEALGWEPSSASVPGVVTFFHGPCVLALWGADSLAAEGHVPARAPGSSGGLSLSINVEAPDDVDAWLAVAEAAGGRVTVPARRPPQFDGRHGYFVDLDEHLWEIAYNPGFPLSDDGIVQLP